MAYKPVNTDATNILFKITKSDTLFGSISIGINYAINVDGVEKNLYRCSRESNLNNEEHKIINKYHIDLPVDIDIYLFHNDKSYKYIFYQIKLEEINSIIINDGEENPVILINNKGINKITKISDNNWCLRLYYCGNDYDALDDIASYGCNIF
jgi:hypothetical protein